jgi:hypothetical protein
MVEKDAVSKDFSKQILGYGLTTVIRRAKLLTPSHYV